MSALESVLINELKHQLSAIGELKQQLSESTKQNNSLKTTLQSLKETIQKCQNVASRATEPSSCRSPEIQEFHYIIDLCNDMLQLVYKLK